MSDMNEHIVRIGVNVFVIENGKLLWGNRIGKTSGWCLPGGKFEFGESLTGGAARELEEETGIKVKEEDLEFIQLINEPEPEKDSHYIHINFLAKKWEGEPRVTEPEAFAEWRWFDLETPPDDIFFGHKLFLPAFLKKVSLVA
jgi:8-oxo-dGTP diphosphatase